MKKKILSIVLILTLLFAVNNINAYELQTYQPGTTTFYWTKHSSLPSTFNTAALTAQGKWTRYKIRTAANTDTSVINPNDSKSVIGYVDFAASGLNPSGIAVTLLPNNNYTTFDIVANGNLPSGYSFGNGSSSSYLDRQGVMTHEFGHVCGLDDLTIFQVWTYNKYSVPTMFGLNSFDGTSNIFYYTRSLQSDDTAGMYYTATH